MNDSVLSGGSSRGAVNTQALLDLLGMLDRADYDFVPPTPLTHRRAFANGSAARSDVLRRVFGWSCAVGSDELPPDFAATMAAAGVLERQADGVRSTVRVARLNDLFLHSAFPTETQDAVFFGPDSYRFARLITQEIGICEPPAAIVDIGTGSGIGAMVAARLRPTARVIGTDINPSALELARVNADHAGCRVEFVETGSLAGIGTVDLSLANPPYIIDAGKRRYRDGGEQFGTGVALEMAKSALSQLRRGGRLILYTGSPIIGGRDPLQTALEQLCTQHEAVLRYNEIDPDVFGEELERPEYAGIERIALIAAVAQRL